MDYAQALDLTVRLGDCLLPDHLARFVVDSVAHLSLLSGSPQFLHLFTDGEGSWTTESGEAFPLLKGCLNVDISATPFTNTPRSGDLLSSQVPLQHSAWCTLPSLRCM